MHFNKHTKCRNLCANLIALLLRYRLSCQRYTAKVGFMAYITNCYRDIILFKLLWIQFSFQIYIITSFGRSAGAQKYLLCGIVLHLMANLQLIAHRSARLKKNTRLTLSIALIVTVNKNTYTHAHKCVMGVCVRAACVHGFVLYWRLCNKACNICVLWVKFLRVWKHLACTSITLHGVNKSKSSVCVCDHATIQILWSYSFTGTISTIVYAHSLSHTCELHMFPYVLYYTIYTAN